MACMKCGKKTKDQQVFCSACLAVMEAYPVKPDVHVQLPNRQKSAAAKKAGRKRYIMPAEEQVVHLRKALHRARAVCVVLALLLCAAGLVLLQVFFAPGQPEQLEDSNIGTNYSYNDSID